jgi:hypothetical protein
MYSAFVLICRVLFSCCGRVASPQGTVWAPAWAPRLATYKPEAKPEATPRLYRSAECSSTAATASGSVALPHRPGHYDRRTCEHVDKGASTPEAAGQVGALSSKACVCAAKLRPSLKLFEGTSPRAEDCSNAMLPPNPFSGCVFFDNGQQTDTVSNSSLIPVKTLLPSLFETHCRAKTHY